MTDREKVIKGLEYCTLQARKGWPYEPEITKSGCEISVCPYIGNCGDMLFDALALLKEQNNCENCAIAIEDRQPVVRCKDCKHYAVEDHNGNFHGYEILAASDIPTCHRWGNDACVVIPDGYCFLAERR